MSDWSSVIAGLIAGFIGGGGLGVAIYHSVESMWVRKARARRAARARLTMMKVYVAAATASADHQDRQIGWSQQCAGILGEVTANVDEMGRSGPDPEESSGLMAGWLSQALLIGGDEKKVNDLRSHLAKLRRCVDRTIEAIPSPQGRSVAPAIAGP